MSSTPPEDAHQKRMKPHDPQVDLNEIAEILRNLMDNDMQTEGVPRQNRPAPPNPGQPSIFFNPPEDEVPLVNDVPPEWNGGYASDDLGGPFPSLDELPVNGNGHGHAAPEESAKLVGGPRNFGKEEMRDRAIQALSDMKRMSGQNTHRPPDAPPPVQPAPLPAQPERPPAPQQQQHYMPQGSQRIRLNAYMEWVRDVTQCTQILIADSHGYPLMKDQVDADNPLVASGLQLMNVLGGVRQQMRVSNTCSGVYLPLNQEQWLCVLECEANGAHFCLCLVTHAPLNAEAASELTKYLVMALEGTSF